MATIEKKPQEKVKNAHAMLKTLPPPPQTLIDSKNNRTFTTGPWIGEVISRYSIILINIRVDSLDVIL